LSRSGSVTVVLGGFGVFCRRRGQRDCQLAPGSAESTQALQKTPPSGGHDAHAVVVYQRDGGITLKTSLLHRLISTSSARWTVARSVSGRRRHHPVCRHRDHIDGQTLPVPPDASTDGEAMQVVVPIDAGKDGWLIMPDLVDHMRLLAETDANGMTTHIAGYAGLAADQAEAFQGIDGFLILAALCVVIVILLFTYRSPILWLFPVICVVTALFRRA
jgi:RND superfamily putative drug exporter